MKKLFVILSLSVLFITLTDAHPWKPRYHIIVDTDGGIDDMKALSMLLASPDVHVLAVTVSSGVLDNRSAYIKVKSLLDSYYHNGIPVGINRSGVNNATVKFKPPDFKWGNESVTDPASAPEAVKVISEILKYEDSKLSLVCLGGLSTAAKALKEIPEFRSGVKDIIWSCEGIGKTDGFNYSIDRPSAEYILKSGINVDAVSTGSGDQVQYSEDFITRLKDINTPYAAKISEFLGSPFAKSHKFSFLISDELIPLFMHFPSFFSLSQNGSVNEVNVLKTDSLKYGIYKILKREAVKKNQVINELPSDPSFYFDDIAPYVTSIINRYGEEEWQAGVLANELHRHLGVYAIIGVKMGIRIREYFNVGVDEFEAVSHAGSTPPLSCMNDGIQVSTGATPGHGLLKVNNDNPLPKVEFRHLNHKIAVSLKPDINSKISGELKEINFIYGLDSDIYWELVRKNAIKYWRDLDRHDIFIIEEIE